VLVSEHVQVCAWLMPVMSLGIIVISQQARHGIMFDLIGFTHCRPFATCPYITEPAQQLSLGWSWARTTVHVSYFTPSRLL